MAGFKDVMGKISKIGMGMGGTDQSAMPKKKPTTPGSTPGQPQPMNKKKKFIKALTGAFN